jgi:hypothetical protein
MRERYRPNTALCNGQTHDGRISDPQWARHTTRNPIQRNRARTGFPTTVTYVAPATEQSVVLPRRRARPWPLIDRTAATHQSKRKVNTMKTTHRTTIDDLAIAGSELSEEHLSLASGGRPLMPGRIDWTYMGSGPCYTDNSCVIDPIYVEDSCQP